MSDRNPRSLWDELLQAFRGWMQDPGDDDKDQREQASDPTLLYHLLFTVPLVIAFLTMVKRA